MSYTIRHAYSSLLPGTLDEFAARHLTFIETGTNTGQGVEAAIAAGFARIISIEQDAALWAEASERYGRYPRIAIMPGSSARVLAAIAPTLTAPACFYLDAHGDDQNPLLEELTAIALSPCDTHTILIDDVRMFGTAAWHGIQLGHALELLERINADYKIGYRSTAHAPRDLLVARL